MRYEVLSSKPAFAMQPPNFLQNQFWIRLLIFEALWYKSTNVLCLVLEDILDRPEEI